MSGEWKEFVLQAGERVSYAVTSEIASCQTRYQHIEILQTHTFGRALFIDDKPQSSEVDFFLFNEGLVHPALCMLPQPQQVFVAGVGPGAGIREILKHRTIQRVVACEVDEMALDLYRMHLLSWSANAFDDPRLDLRLNDARVVLESLDSSETFDCVLVDLPDPLEGSPSARLFTQEFYRIASHRLGTDGILVTQAGRTNLNNLEYHQSVRSTAGSVFEHVRSYAFHYPFYAESWGFVVATNRPGGIPEPSAYEIDVVLSGREVSTAFYDGAIHHSLFVLPRCIRCTLAQAGRISTDISPNYVI